MDQLPRLGKREQICLLLFTCNYMVSVWRVVLFLWVLGMGYVISLWHSLSLPYNYLLYFILSKKISNGQQRYIHKINHIGLTKLEINETYPKSLSKVMTKNWCNQNQSPAFEIKMGSN